MSVIIFDFDGTIADSFDYVSDFLAKQAKVQLSDSRREELRHHSMAAMARKLHIHWWRLPRLFLKGRGDMAANIDQLKPFKGINEVLRKLHAEGHELFLLSSNTVQTIHNFLHAHDLHTYFLEIYGGAGLFGKAPAFRRLLKEQHLDPANIICVGDELRDIEAAQSLKLRCVAVSWGYARLADLQAAKPTALVHEPAELLDVLENL